MSRMYIPVRHSLNHTQKNHFHETRIHCTTRRNEKRVVNRSRLAKVRSLWNGFALTVTPKYLEDPPRHRRGVHASERFQNYPPSHIQSMYVKRLVQS